MRNKSVAVAYSYRKWPFPIKQKGCFEISASSMEECIQKAVRKFNEEISHYSEAYVFFNIENSEELMREFNYMGIND